MASPRYLLDLSDWVDSTRAKLPGELITNGVTPWKSPYLVP